MASGTFDIAAMRRVAGEFDNYSQEYQSVYKQLLSTATTMGAAWRGEDNQVYINSINSLCDDLQQMVTKLKVGADTLRQQADMYEKGVFNNINNVPK